MQPSLLSLQHSKPIASALLFARMPSLVLKGKVEGHRQAAFLWTIDRDGKYDQIDRQLPRPCSKSFTAALFRWLSGFMARRESAFM